MTDDTTGVALVGYGYWGNNLARNIQAARSLRLVGIADTDAAQRADAARTYTGISIWSDLDRALAQPEVDAVVLATPAQVHAAQARAVLDAGRHVLVEKPLATEPADAEELVERAKQAERICMVGHTFLYSPPVERLRDDIVAGELGKVQYLYSQRLSLGKIRRDCNALWNFAPHDVSIMLFLLDERPVEVSATSVSVLDPAVPDVFFAQLGFPSGIGAHLHVSWIDPRKTRTMTVVGDEKMAIYNDVSADQKLWVIDAGVARSGSRGAGADGGFGEYESLGDFQWRTRAGDILIPKIDLSEPLRHEMEAFGEACRSGRPPRTDARHGADVVAVLAAIDESARRRGAPVELTW